MINRRSAFLSLAFALAACAVALFAAPEGVVQETTLPNGLRIITKEVHAAPVVSFSVWYAVGSKDEHPGITGVSHFLEHMTFKGTRLFSADEMVRALRRVGARDNAGTAQEFTWYWETLSSDHLELAMRIEADRMNHSLLRSQDQQTERTVVLSELEGNENDPESALYHEVVAAAFQAHPYRWPIIGWRSDVEGVTNQELQQYYRQRYKPERAAVVIVGDFDTNRARALVGKYFGGIPRGKPVPPVRTVEPRQRGERRLKLRQEGTTAYVMMAYHMPAITHPDTYALALLDQVLSGGRSSRLYQALVETQLATQAWSDAGVRHDPSLFMLGATARTEVTPENLERALLEQVEAAKANPLAEEERQRALNQIEASFTFSKDSVTGQAFRLGYYATINDWRYLDTYLDRIRQVTAADVQRVAQQYLTEDNRTVGWFVPIPTGKATPPASAAPPGGPAHYPAASLPAPPAPVPLPSPAPKAKTKLRPSPKRTRVVLPNGLTVIVQENHANATVAVRGLVSAGSIFDPPGKNGLAAATAELLDRGTETRTSLQIAQAIEFVGASLDAQANAETASLSGAALSKDLSLLLQIMADIVRHPTFPQAEVEKSRTRALSRLQEGQQDPEQQASRAFAHAIFPAGHPYHELTYDQQAASYTALTRDDVVAFHRQYYAPQNCVLVIVGDTTTDQALASVRECFGDWPQSGPPAQIAIPDAPLPAKPERIVIPMMDKSQVNLEVGYPSGLKRTDRGFYAANLMNLILGGGALSSRLGDKIREELGLVYDVYSTFNATLGAGPWEATLGCNPKNVDRALEALFAEVKRFQQEGATQTEVTEAIDFICGAYPLNLETNGGIAQALLNSELYGLGLDYPETFASRYRAVTREQVNAAAKQYLHPDQCVVVIAGPYSGK